MTQLDRERVIYRLVLRPVEMRSSIESLSIKGAVDKLGDLWRPRGRQTGIGTAD